MDEEDFINNLGWNRRGSESEEVLVDESGSIHKATASTSQADGSPLSETVQDNVSKDLSMPKKSLRSARGRGRPPRNAYLNIKPTRESQRVRRSTVLMNCDRVYSKTERNKWSQEDLGTLLAALQEFGPKNIKAIASQFMHKSEGDIRCQIQMWKEFSAMSLQSKMVPDIKKIGSALNNSCTKLDEWIEHFEWLASTSSTKSFALANVFALIAEFGKFPRPEECNGVDFRAMYRYLHCILNGEPYIGVNPRTAQEIILHISHMLSMIKDYNLVTNLQPHLYNLTHPPRTRWRNYGRQPCRRKNEELNPEVIMNLPHLNPLSIPPHMLVKPETVQYYSDDNDDEGLHKVEVKDSED